MIKDKEYYENLDKRTKEYKEWVLSQNLEPHTPLTQEDLEAKHEANPTVKTTIGLGDVADVALNNKLIKPITNIVKSIIWDDGEDCNCDERKEKMNSIPVIRHKIRVECLTIDEYNFLKPLLANNNPISGKQVKRLRDVHSRVFNEVRTGECTSCSLKYVINELKAVLSTYE